MKAIIQPSTLSDQIQAPASKSSMQRACAAALLARGTSIILNPGHSNDDRAAMDIIKRLGATVDLSGDRLRVDSRGIAPTDDSINCGESGLSIRMFTPIAALSHKPITINGSGSLLTRPMDFFDTILPQLGVKVQSNQGKLPLLIEGPLIPADIEVDGSLSSQFLTGLLMAYAASDARDVSIRVHQLRSRPYIDLTLDVMRQFGLKVPVNEGYERFYFDDAVTAPAATHQYTVEGDWSGGSFLLVAGAIAGPCTVRGLDPSSTQADKAILDALMHSNAGMAIDSKGIALHPSPLQAFEFDATDCPDLFPPLVALAAYCNGETRIKGISRLTHKESNRALTLRDEFGKMGLHIVLDEGDDAMIVAGGHGLTGAVVHSRHDHRIAMACAVAALGASSETVVEEAQAVRKSYPDFFSDLQTLHALVKTESLIQPYL